VPPRLMVAVILHTQSRFAEAEKAYREILDLDPTAAAAANNLAWLYADSSSNLDIALQLAQMAKQRRPDDPNANDTLGWVYLKKDLVREALRCLEESAAAVPDNPVVQYHLGMAYLKAGDAPRARVALGRSLQLNPGFPAAADARQALSRLGS